MPDPDAQFDDFFRRATGRDPYPYQRAFALSTPWPHLLRAPTGAGKTAAAILGWLYRLRAAKVPGTPRRLAYCLPMRVLVEQSAVAAEGWVAALGWEDEVEVHTLMGGAEAGDWFLHPERPAVLIGTQDMLLSRALNRGYAASRFQWPIDFGLLNGDCLWVYDEPQLMGAGVATSAQLAGLRARLGVVGDCPSVWMSATLEPAWLDTIDFRESGPAGEPLELTAADYVDLPLKTRMEAEKALRPLGLTLTKENDERELRALAAEVASKHNVGAQTLVVMNTVRRAKGVFAALQDDRELKAAGTTLLLVHSRFRPEERERLNVAVQDSAKSANRILVATQVVEAGVDISSRVLVTELAPWASVVQRAGRCNRTGEDGPGEVYWIDAAMGMPSAPYQVADLEFARGHLERLNGADVSPRALDEYRRDNETPGEPFLRFERTHVLRRRDLVDLFDTAPDLSGNDIDVARFVRGDDPEADVQFFWRRWPDGKPGEERRRRQTRPRREELCSAPIGDAKKFLESGPKRPAYAWDHLDRKWVRRRPEEIRPGMVLMLRDDAGGYDWDESTQTGLGFDPDAKGPVRVLGRKDRSPESDEEAVDSDPLTTIRQCQTIAEHTDLVYKHLESILELLPDLPGGWAGYLRQAARWHDIGKGHTVFQAAMLGANPALVPGKLWAKSGNRKRLRYSRKYFRHEVASALAMLEAGRPFEEAYLALSHHGRARLGIRSLPGEEPPERDIPFALGVVHDDELPAVDLGGGVERPASVLDLSPIRLGGDDSWTGRALELRDRLGPFALAYLEAILRAADRRASREADPCA